jgi:hypothetical protein
VRQERIWRFRIKIQSCVPRRNQYCHFGCANETALLEFEENATGAFFSYFELFVERFDACSRKSVAGEIAKRTTIGKPAEQEKSCNFVERPPNGDLN